MLFFGNIRLVIFKTNNENLFLSYIDNGEIYDF